ncbi:MAG: hypothetical protein HY553_01820 [Elusimicrobia bacterium]|nr:hypothetical protein [Elusimicrobiota bacterium]
MERPGESPDVWYRELSIEFKDGSREYFHIERKPTGTHIPLLKEKPEPWTDLKYQKCPGCPLPDMILSCPAALSLQTTLGKLRPRHSIEPVKATAVDARGRSQTVEWTMQEVGATLVQLAVFATDCPIGRKLKPYLAGLRPFVTSLELSKHIGEQILRKYGGSLEASRDELLSALKPLHEVFMHLSERLKADPNQGGGERLSRDAVPNSISTVDAFAQLLALRADKLFQNLSKEAGWETKPAQAPADAPAGGLVGRIKSFFS